MRQGGSSDGVGRVSRAVAWIVIGTRWLVVPGGCAAAGRAALSFAMLAIVPLRSSREFALTMCVGVLLETFLMRSALVPALLALVRPAPSAPSRAQSGLVAIAQIVTA
jgi:uncharacterized membrane protein YdfJ with MMPL/SSD domain